MIEPTADALAARDRDHCVRPSCRVLATFVEDVATLMLALFEIFMLLTMNWEPYSLFAAPPAKVTAAEGA